MEEKKNIIVDCEYYTGEMRFNCKLFCDDVGRNKNCQDFNCVYKQLQLKDKMIELMAKRMEVAFMGDSKEFIRLFKRKALAEVEE